MHFDIGKGSKLFSFSLYRNTRNPIAGVFIALPGLSFRLERTQTRNLESTVTVGSTCIETRAHRRNGDVNRCVLPVNRWFRDAELNDGALAGYPANY